jgi:hypothetical protein
MALAVSTDLYSISVGETVQMLLASTPYLDGTRRREELERYDEEGRNHADVD